MLRRGLGLTVAVAAAAVLAGEAIGGASEPTPAAVRHALPPRVGKVLAAAPRPAGTVKALPSIPQPPRVATTNGSTCFVGVPTCSVHPCVEFVAAPSTPGRLEPSDPLPARPTCDAYPRAWGKVLYAAP